MTHRLIALIASLIIATLLLIPLSACAQVLPVSRGGTGSSTLSGILLGNGTSSVRSVTVGNGLTLSGNTLSATGGSGTVATTSPWIAGELAQVANGTTIRSIATSSLGLVTTNVAEGSNLYFTNARARSALSSAFTTGAIPFGNGTNYDTDAVNLFWDNTNKRLGVDTNNPQTTLDVLGTASTTRLFVDTAGTAALPAIAFGTDQNSGIYSSTDDRVSISTGGGQRAEFGTSTIRFFAPNMALAGTAIDANMALTTSGNVTNPSAEQVGANFSRTLIITSSNSSTISGGIFNVSTSANAFNATGILRGGRFSVQNSNTATLSRAFGGDALIYNVGAGTITDAAGYNATFQNLVAGGTITNAYGFRVQSFPFNNGTITNSYGVFVDDITVGTTTNAFSFYANDANARNFFAGNTGIGTTTPSTRLSIFGGGISLNPGATGKPTCNVANRGTIWTTFGGAGVADTIEVCRKDAADVYGWLAL